MRSVKEGEDRVELKNLHADFEMVISRRGRWEKMRWRVSWGRRKIGGEAAVVVESMTAAEVGEGIGGGWRVWVDRRGFGCGGGWE